MCGRGRCTLRPDDFSRACYLNPRPVRHLNTDRYQPAYNVGPGYNVPVIRRDDEGDTNGVVLQCMKWGLVPSFTKKNEKIDHFRMFNARSESLKEKASFRRLIPKNRCLVSFEGFYEWKKDGSKKQPYYVHFKDGRPLVFAGLFDSWKNLEGEILYTFTIITTSSSSSPLGWLHDRMPVILGDKESTHCWLNDSSSSNLDKVLKPYEETDLVWYPVTSAIGKLSFDGPECIKEVQVKKDETKPISQFFLKKQVHAPQEPNLEKTPKSVKEEPKSNSPIENTKIKDKHVDMSLQKSKEAKMKDGSQQSITKKDGNDNSSSIASPRGTLNIKHMRDDAKETERAQTSPVRKRGKGSDDKQPTLFSYFGRSQ